MTTEVQTQTIQQFLTKYPVTIELTEVPENPSMEKSKDEMINYYVTLAFEGRMMSLYFSTGLGWVETRTGQSAQGVTYRKRDKTFLVRSGNTLYDGNDGRMFGKYRIRKPKVEDVLNCLASDASGIDQSFEDWASELGYDTDSRKAEQIYQTCQKQARELRQLLGVTVFEELLNDTERL